MKRFLKPTLIALLGVLLLVPGGLLRADRGEGGWHGDDDDGGRFYVYSPGFYPGYGWGWNSPWWGDDGDWGYGWPWGAPFYRSPRSGEVKIETSRKHASVYVDGGYAGRAGKAKKLRLRPGNHVIQLRNSQGHIFFQDKVHVMRGKTVVLDANIANYPPQQDPANGRAGPPLAPQASERPRT
jgi:hypothetical protein